MGWFRRNEHDEEQLSAYLDGELNARQAENVERHLSTCAACTALLDELRETRALLSAMPAQTPRRSFVLGAEYAQAPVREEARPSKRFNLALAPAVALSVFVALLVVDLGDFSSSSTSSDESASLTAASSRQATDDAASNAAGTTMMQAPDVDSAAGANAGEATGPIEPATLESATGGTEAAGGAGGAAGSGPADAPVAPPAAMSAEDAPAASGADVAVKADGAAAEQDTPEETIGFESPQSDDDDGVSTLRILQVLAAAAFLASGFYVFVWPRLSRGGS